MDYSIPTPEEFKAGYLAYEKHEKRDAMYKVAEFLVHHFWGNYAEVTNGLGVLLLTWNQACYRYGSFDFDNLQACLEKHNDIIEGFRKRSIESLDTSDEAVIKALFNEFREALQIAYGKKKGTKTPVGVAKALHLLAPKFFPIWDDKIAKAYRCNYTSRPNDKYLDFCKISKEMAARLEPVVSGTDKSILKLIDQYNYAKYTYKWI